MKPDVEIASTGVKEGSIGWGLLSYKYRNCAAATSLGFLPSNIFRFNSQAGCKCGSQSAELYRSGGLEGGSRCPEPLESLLQYYER